MQCLSEPNALEYVLGHVQGEVRRTIDEHVVGCEGCQQTLLHVSRGRRLPLSGVPGLSDVEDTDRRALPREGDLLAGRFRLERPAGDGAMGMVFVAWDTQLNARVALKILHPQFASQPEYLKRLHQEILVGRRIAHPNVCRAYDLGTDGRLHFITMEVLSGDTLDVVVRERRPEAKEAARLLTQIAAALDAAHQAGVIHRDLKPSNIMVSPSGEVRVMDFGLASDLQGERSLQSEPIGTPAYWSPEQARGERATPVSDLYSFGVVAAQLFTGRLPAPGTAGLEEIPRQYRAIVERCLRVEPGKRYPSARALRAALEAADAGRGAPRTLLVGGLLVGVLGVSGGVLFFRGGPAVAPLPVPMVVGPLPPVVAPPTPILPAPAPVVALPPPAPPTPEPGATPTEPPPRRIERTPVKSAVKGPMAAASTARKQAGSAEAVAPLPAVDATALEAGRQQLAELEQERISRKLLPDDLPGYRAALEEARQALQAGNIEAAARAVAQLGRDVAAAKIDEGFVGRKLKRLTAVAKARSQEGVEAKELNAAFLKVHSAFFAGEFEQANQHLNEIQQALDRAAR